MAWRGVAAVEGKGRGGKRSVWPSQIYERDPKQNTHTPTNHPPPDYAIAKAATDVCKSYNNQYSKAT